MKKFERLHSIAVPLDRSNIDTDAILPGRFLKTIQRTGLGRYLFYGWRFDQDGRPVLDFELNRPCYAGARILIAADNFGCGSSREHAVWALMDYGFDVVIAESFGDIFRNNSLKNGLLPVALPRDDVATLRRLAEGGSTELEVDLESCLVRAPGGVSFRFEVPEFARQCLLNGWDEIAVTELRYLDQITAYERRRAHELPWLFPDLRERAAEEPAAARH